MYTVYPGEFIYTVNMHCISSVGSMAFGLGVSDVGLVGESVEINLCEFIYEQNVFFKAILLF